MEASSVKGQPIFLEKSTQTTQTKKLESAAINSSLVKLPSISLQHRSISSSYACWIKPPFCRLPVIKFPPCFKLIELIKKLLGMLQGIGCQKPGNLQDLVKLLIGGSVSAAKKAIAQFGFNNFRVLPAGTMTTQIYTPGLVTIWVGADGRVTGIGIQPKKEKDNKVSIFENKYSAVSL